MRLLYERVPHHYTPDLGKLDNPIVKYIQVFNTSLDVKYTISDLPKGKYIMCAQILDKIGQVFRYSSYFKYPNNKLAPKKEPLSTFQHSLLNRRS